MEKCHSVFLTFADGNTEAEDKGDTLFDEDRVISYLVEQLKKSVESPLEGVFPEVMKCMGAA